jgi:membrane-associated phospholipid phosphatase
MGGLRLRIVNAMPSWRAALATACFVLAAPGAAAQEPRVHELRHDTRVDVAVTSMGAAWLVMSEVLKATLVPEKCRWCYRAEDGTSLLNPYDGRIRKQLIWQDTNAADLASDVLVFGLEPASALGLTALAANDEGALSGFPVDALIIAEATVVAGVINQIAKFGFARERPFVHYLPRAPEAIRRLTAGPSDDNLSFFSGHATFAFVIATSSGTVASLRGYRLAPVIWATGLTMATSVGYLRIAADKHYFSDVMTGLVVGSIVGVGMPLLFHSRASAPGSVSTSAQMLAASPARPVFSLSGRF